jgi:uncharacterized protein
VANDNQVVVVLSRFVPAKNCPSFETALADLIAAAEPYGRASAEILRGPPTQAGRLYHVVYRFADEAALSAWEASDQRQALAARAEALAIGGAIGGTIGGAGGGAGGGGTRRLTGLEAWFDIPGQAPPSRHRMALLTWVGIWPLVSLALLLLAPLLAGYPFLARTALTSALLVLTMTYLVMPLLARAASRWLYPAPR